MYDRTLFGMAAAEWYIDINITAIDPIAAVRTDYDFQVSVARLAVAGAGKSLTCQAQRLA